MKIYLAGPFKRGPYLSEVASRLRAREHIITRAWWDAPEPLQIALELDKLAIHDCDIIIAFIWPECAGTLYEIGYAAALKKKIVCVHMTEYRSACVFLYTKSVVNVYAEREMFEVVDRIKYNG